MPTAKTTKKTSDVKKSPVKRAKAAPKATPKTVSKKPQAKSTSSMMSSFRTMKLGDLQKNVMDPKNRKSLYLAAGLIVVALIIYFGKSLFIAATVNGQPISRLSVIKDLEQQSGRIVLESIITRSLVEQEASKKKIEVSDKDIDSEIAKIQKQFASQGQNLDQLLAAQGLSKEKFREEMRIQIVVTKILGDQAKITDKEFNDFLAKNQDLLTNEKDQNAAKASLRAQMEQQKLAQKYQEWIANIKKNAKINYFVSY